ncbi:MAG: ABC transporter permease [Lachnospiraceae bacterium]|jgi:ribose transport system permease protein|nr:ABC transporter permease [Lachnospiraceae bacterium]
MMKNLKQSWLARYGLLWLLILLVIVGAVWKPVFLAPQNLTSMIVGRVTVGFLAVAMTICMAAGEMDISLGYMLGTCVMLSAWVGSLGASPGVILLVALVAGIVLGAMNGLLVVVVKIPSTIVTLGSGMIMYAISMWTNNSKSITGILPAEVTALFKTKILGLQPCVWGMFLLFLIAFWMMETTPLGDQIYAVGFSPRVAHLAGISSDMIKMLSFVMCGGIVGIAALFNLGQSGNAYVNTGPSYLMPCLAVAFLSITTHKVGRYNVVGSLIALITLGVVYNLAGLQGVPFWFENVANGVVLLGVVLFNGAESRSAHTG